MSVCTVFQRQGEVMKVVRLEKRKLWKQLTVFSPI
jgi:hypothetical protein